MSNELVAVSNLNSVFARQVELPTVVMWNRLEGRPRTENFLRALRAEVRDPLWMLCKQWQVGEFQGDDAASPVFAKVHMQTTRLTRYQPGPADAVPFDDGTPLEATVEHRPVDFAGQDAHLMSLDLRLLAGRQWIKWLNKEGLNGLASDFQTRWPFTEPDPAQRTDAYITAHPEAWQSVAAVAGRAMDGGALLLYLKADPSHRAWDGMTVPVADQPTIDAIAERFVAWFDRLFLLPGEQTNQAWQGNRLEYKFAVSAPEAGAEKVLVADEYNQGRLDWYSLDMDSQSNGLPGAPPQPPPEVEQTFTSSFFPVNIQFEGMPSTRWWEFEDSKTSFGDIKPDTTDVNKLLLMEFGLVYANDWFLLPFQLPAGSLAKVAGLAVTDVFGERTWIGAAGTGADDDWQRWAMYQLSIKGQADEPADTTLVVLPTVPKVNDGQPLDEVLLVRDEVSNMVWAVEKRIPLPTGRSKPGGSAGKELGQRFVSILDGEIEGGLVTPDLPEAAASIRYQVMRGVPEHWIPFVPVHIEGDDRQIQLQRASMPRIIEGDPTRPAKIKPRTTLIRQGLGETPAQRYFLFEEEVPRAGVRVTRAFQRTRWHDGRVYTWVGVRKQTGRGEGSSGLAFDRVQATGKQRRRALRNR